MSDKKKIQEKKPKDTLWEFFLKSWEREEHYCKSCGKWLGDEPLSIYFDHLLEKSKYPEVEYAWDNIFLCCWDCHTLRTNGHPTEKHQEAIIDAKKRFGV